MPDLPAGFAFRLNIPTWLDGISTIVLIKDSYFESSLKASYRQFCYGIKADKVLGGTFLSAGIRYQEDENFKALFSVKRVVLGVDLFGDVALGYDGLTWSPRVLTGFFKEWQDFKLYGEYYYAGTVDGLPDHTMGLAAGYNNIGETSIDLGIQWFHTFVDDSGIVTIVATWPAWKFITATIGLPIVYGSDDSRYIRTNADPAKRRIALAFGLEFAISF